MTLKVAIVGCGKIADGHVEEVQKLGGRATVIAACDRELVMAEQLAPRYSIPKTYESLSDLLSRLQPVQIHTCLSHSLVQLPLCLLLLCGGLTVSA